MKIRCSYAWFTQLMIDNHVQPSIRGEPMYLMVELTQDLDKGLQIVDGDCILYTAPEPGASTKWMVLESEPTNELPTPEPQHNE